MSLFVELRIILILGRGSLDNGFSDIIAEVKRQEITQHKFPGSLPPAPVVAELHRRWQYICGAVKSSRSQSRIKIKETGITNFSEDDPHAIYLGLQEAMSRWLASEEFYAGIEQNLRNEIGESGPNSQAFEVFIESNEKIWELPWEAWGLREDYKNCEIIKSSSHYKTPLKQAPIDGKFLDSRGRILCVFGNSRGINLKTDKKSIKKSLGDRCKLKFVKQPKPEELRALLDDEQNWQILYYGGHGDRNDANGWLEINHAESDNTVTVDYLKDSLNTAIFKGLELLILNSCSSLGLATDLVMEGLPLPSTIVMRAPVPDEIAHDLIKSLFRYLGDDEPLFLAFRKAKDDLRTKWDSYFPGASAIPVLCQQQTFKGVTLPQKKDSPAIPAVDVAGDRANHNRSIALSKLMRRVGISAVTTGLCYLLMGPKLAQLANQIGIEKHRNNQPLVAKAYYNLATLTNINYAQPYYNMSILCDQLNDGECASEAMQQAVWRGLPDAYAQRSRSLLLENKLDQALKAIDLCLTRTEYNYVKSACLKNRGWVRFKQNQFDSAETDLRNAIKINDNSPEAQCLLARVLETKGQPQAALKHWEKTLKYSKSSIPEQDECLQLARQRLPAKGKKQ